MDWDNPKSSAKAFIGAMRKKGYHDKAILDALKAILNRKTPPRDYWAHGRTIAEKNSPKYHAQDEHEKAKDQALSPSEAEAALANIGEGIRQRTDDTPGE